MNLQHIAFTCGVALFFSFQSSAQNFTKAQLQAAAKLQGVDPSQVEEALRQIPSTSKASSDRSSEVSPINNTSFGQTTSTTPIAPIETTGVFGASFFNNPKIDLQPQINIATPQDYQLGPADELYIELWGAATQAYTTEIRRDGVISIPGVAPIYISGLSVRAAKNKIQRSLQKIYAGLGSTVEGEKVFLDISLVKARSILVNIIGQANTPGTYSLNGFASPLLAIYAAGGIAENGSYRNISLLRKGKKIKTIDLYSYLLQGKFHKVQLRDQDVLLIPTVEKTVHLSGEVYRPARFELLEEETLSDLLSFGGGFTANAQRELLTLASRTPSGINIQNVKAADYGKLQLSSGDEIEVKALGNDYRNRVIIEGAVNSPGTYALTENLTIGALLQSSGGLTDDGFATRAQLYREKNGKVENVVSVDLTAEASKGIALQNNDKLVVPSFVPLNERSNINLTGEIKKTGNQTFYPGITLLDALLQGEGFTANALPAGVEIYRLSLNQKDESQYTLFGTYAFGPDLELISENPPLHPRDIVNVRTNPDIRPIAEVRISGEIKTPGTFVLENIDETALSVIQRAGGLTSGANQNGIYIQRATKLGQNLGEQIGDSLTRVSLQNFIKIPVVLEEKNPIVLRSGDRIFVSVKDPSVTISGAVLNPTAIPHRAGKSLRGYIHAAGGTKSNALKRKIFVVEANGTSKGTKSFLGFKFYPKVNEGATIVVPERAEDKRRMSPQEWIGITSGISTLGILINTLINQ
ncbi:MAG: SLBB domain-containing protein [Flavobacteriaceae bacterium]